MKTDDRLVFQGLLLFLLGLLTGLLLVAGPSFVVNPRGVLAGHLEGTMNGMLLILVGLFVSRVRWSALQARIGRGALLYSCFANWFFSTLGGILGVSEATPLAGAGHHASAAAEQLILAGLVTVAISMVVAVGLLLMGVRRSLSNQTA